MISGAISLAMSEVNAGALHSELGHELAFVVAETRGEETSSIRQTAALWTDRIYGYIGPQETCVHEGRMAAAFNIPMISYVSQFLRRRHWNWVKSVFSISCPDFLESLHKFKPRNGFAAKYNPWPTRT